MQRRNAFRWSTAVLALGAFTPGCPSPPPVGDESCPALAVDADARVITLGAGGVPQGTFGDASDPDFATGFSTISGWGFDKFVPIFITDEAGVSTEEMPFFTSIACAQNNPFLVAGDVGVVMPGYLIGLDLDHFGPNFDPVAYRTEITAFETTCLDGDLSNITGGLYLHDEPANNFTALAMDGDDATNYPVENVAAMAEVLRDVSDLPLYLVEAPLPLFLPFLTADPTVIEAYVDAFRGAVAQTATVPDVYGYDWYPVDITTDFAGVASVVDDVFTHAPQARPMVVLQGFGFADQNIDTGTSGRQPTRDEVRAQVFIALSRGAKEIFWYGQSGIQEDETNVWDDVVAVVDEVRSLEAAFDLTRTELDVDNDAVVASRFHSATASYTVVANMSNEVQSLTVDASNFPQRRILLGTADITDATEPLPLSLDAYGVVVIGDADCVRSE